MFPRFVSSTIASVLFFVSVCAIGPNIISSENFTPISRQRVVTRCGLCPTTCFPSQEMALKVCNSMCRGRSLCGTQRCTQLNGLPGCGCIGFIPRNFLPCGDCPRVIYRRRAPAVRDCSRRSACRGGFPCRVRPVSRNGSRIGFLCLGALSQPMRESLCALRPPVPVILPPPVAIASSAPSPVPSRAPSMSATVSSTPSMTASPSSSSSITPSNTVSPTPSQTCSFAFAGTIGGPTTSAVCSCGTQTATVTILAPVRNSGVPIFSGAMSVASEALNCYNGCIEGTFSGSCDPAGISTFASDGQFIVNFCCSRCVSAVGVDGQGPFLAFNQCRLAA